MSRGRRLLFLLPFPPRLDAAHGGGRAIAQIIAGLARRHQVALLYLRAPDEPPLDEALRQLCVIVQETPRYSPAPSAWGRLAHGARLLISLCRMRPMWATDWASREFARRLRLFVRTWQPDIVQAEFHIMGQYLHALAGRPAPRFLTIHEPGAHAAPYLQSAPAALRHLCHALDQWAWGVFEPAVLRQATAVVAFTERDRAVLAQRRATAHIWKIPLEIQAPEHPLDPVGDPQVNLLFVGNFIHPPNVDAALRLARSIFPRVQREYPHLRLYLVGPQPPPALRRLADPNIVVTGQVQNVASYLDRATLVVAPLRLGGGMRIKVLEALAAGKAVVASPLAAAGIPVTDGQEIALAESDQEFAGQILHLLGNPAQRVSMARRARAWACGHMRPERAVQAYEALYETFLASPVDRRQDAGSLRPEEPNCIGAAL